MQIYFLMNKLSPFCLSLLSLYISRVARSLARANLLLLLLLPPTNQPNQPPNTTHNNLLCCVVRIQSNASVFETRVLVVWSVGLWLWVALGCQVVEAHLGLAEVVVRGQAAAEVITATALVNTTTTTPIIITFIRITCNSNSSSSNTAAITTTKARAKV